MSNYEYNTSMVVLPDGRAFAASEESIKSTPIAGNIYRLLAKFNKIKSTNALIANTQEIDKNAMLTPLIAKTLKEAAGTEFYGNNSLAMSALSAADGVANSENLSHLQLIRLFPQIQGAPESYFFLEEAFVKREIPQLEYRESFYDTVQTAEYKDRLEQSKATTTKYDEVKYDLKKLVDKAYTPIEDIYRTIINPQTIDLAQIEWGFKRKRNLSALKAIKEIGNKKSGKLGAFKKLAAGDLHSANHAAEDLNNEFNAFLKTNDVSITHVIMNPRLFTHYTENTWSKSGPMDLAPIRLGGGGVVPLPGIAGVTAIVDVHVPNDTIYCINKPNALRLGEGPNILRRYYDEERDASAIKFIDFHQHLSVNQQITKLDRKFGMILEVTAQP